MTKNQRIVKKFIVRFILKIVDVIAWVWFKVIPRRRININNLNREQRRHYKLKK